MCLVLSGTLVYLRHVSAGTRRADVARRMLDPCFARPALVMRSGTDRSPPVTREDSTNTCRRKSKARAGSPMEQSTRGHGAGKRCVSSSKRAPNTLTRNAGGAMMQTPKIAKSRRALGVRAATDVAVSTTTLRIQHPPTVMLRRMRSCTAGAQRDCLFLHVPTHVASLLCRKQPWALQPAR